MNRKRLVSIAAVVLAIALVAGVAIVVQRSFFGPKTITAYFTSATGVYPGDEVRVSGVKVGTIKSIEPDGTQAKLTLDVDRDVPVPADAKAVIVAQNLVAARYVQLAPAYRNSGPKMADDAVIGVDRTAVPVEWDEVKTQLMKLATDLGPKSGMSTTSVGNFIDSAAKALDNGNAEKLRATLTQLSGVGRVLANGSGNIVDIIKNLQIFVSALRDSSTQIVQFQNRLASLTSVVDDNKSDLDSALKELSVALGEVQRFVAGSRNQTVEQVQSLANVTKNLADHKLVLENLLHVAPNSFGNGYNIYNPDTGDDIGSFALADFSNPVQFICGAIGAIENTTAPETAKLCADYLGPAARLLNFNFLPFPVNPYLMPAPTPENLIYSDPALAPGGAGTPIPPSDPPAVSAYTGAGDVPTPPGMGPPGVPQPPSRLPFYPSPALFPGAPVPAGPPPGPAPANSGPLPAEAGPPDLDNVILPAEAVAPPPPPGNSLNGQPLPAQAPAPAEGTPPA
jgi:phospholipid/cholesterol/gamma-HCH transport system substrate-binding protein